MRCQILVPVAVAIGVGCATPPARPPAPTTQPAAVETPTPGPSPEREDFEAATVGSMPPGWTVAGTAKDVAFTAARGETGTVLEIVTTGVGSGTIKRSLDAARYRGKRIAIRARASCEQKTSRARALVGVDVARPVARGYGDRVRTERIQTAPWQEYVAVGDVAGDATRLDLVVSVASASKVRVDDITVTVLGNAGAGDEPPRALAGRALDNVVAFARLYGIVRYFHPSDEAAALDAAAWERFVVRGVRTVEAAPDAAALATRLEALFAPIAPAVAIYRDGDPAPAAAAIAPPAVHWRHYGIGISKESVYESTRGTGETSRSVSITASIDPAQVRGKELKISVRGRATLRDRRADAGLWVQETQADGKQGFYTEPEAQPALAAGWTVIPVQAKISSDARALTVGVQVIGDAEVWLETPVVTADGKPVKLAGWGTPGADLAAAWQRTGTGYSVAVGDKACDKPRICLHVSAEPAPATDLRPWGGSLGGGVAASVPLELSTSDGKTLPPATAALPAADPMPLLASDRATRLAAIVIAWNVFQHFYPYFDVRGEDWMPELPRRLAEAAVDDGPAALHATLRYLVHDLHDGHGTVVHPGEDASWLAPWLWERIEGKLVITEVFAGCACDLAPGDVVTAIDGEPTERAIAGAAALMSAATEQFVTDKVLRRLRSGAEGGSRGLSVVRGGAVHEVKVALVEPTATLDEKRPASGDEIAPGIRYVNIDKVTEDQWKKILPDLAAAKAVVCDVRGYPNLNLTLPLAHFSKHPLRSAQWHVPTPSRPDREGLTFQTSDWQVPPAAPFIGNVVFLTDGRAVSAAETYMGIVEAYKLGPIVGAATAGTNGNINPFTLPGGYLLWWTGMKVLKHDGSRHHGIGILATVPAARTVSGVTAQRDEVLEKGIEVAQQLIKAAKPSQRRK